MHHLTKPKAQHIDTGAARAPSAWCLTAVLWLAGCHANPHQPRGADASEPQHAASAAAGANAAASAHVRLSATDLSLPLPAAHTSISERQFFAAATRAVRHTYEDDVDDPSQLLALRQRLGRDPQLAGARLIWQPVLETSLARAQTLQALGPTLRALRQALANTWRDEMTRGYRDVDAASCRVAHDAMPAPTSADHASLQDTWVTIEPLGTYPLRVLLDFCQDPRSLYDHE